MEQTKHKFVYVGVIPKRMRKGYAYLCHNRVAREVDTMPGVNGFRAWWTAELPDGFVPCQCGWSGLPHYRHSRLDHRPGRAGQSQV
jgi:hypothetical protein